MKMPRLTGLSNMLFAILILSTIPPNFCQLALASSSYLTFPPRKPSSMTGGLNVRDTRSRTLFTKYGDLKPVLRLNTSAMESEIAAIFKNVAYGSSSALSSSTKVTSATTTSSTTTSKTPTTRHYFHRGSTEAEVFIGKQKEVYPNIPLTSEPIIYDHSESISSASEVYSGIHNNSVYTYLVQPENSNDQISNNLYDYKNDRPRPVMDNYPAFEEPESDLKEVQVRITSVLKKKGYDAIQQEIGRAWSFHIYLTGISFAIVAAVCLLSLSRLSTCSNLLPRGYFITLHLMIFLASFLRCLLFLHDPYGAYDKLPSVLTSLLFNTVDPCLTTAYAIVLMVLLRAARFRLVPLNMQSPLVLATICGIHIGGSVVVDVSTGVLEDSKVVTILNITTQAVTASWGTILCLGYVVSFSSIEKAAQRQQGDMVRLTFNRSNTEGASLPKNSQRPSLTYASRMFLISTLLHGLLIAFVILNLVTTKVPASATSSEAWAWWTQTSLERIIEVALSVLLLATALVLTQQPRSRNTHEAKEEKIFSIFSHCGRATKVMKNIDVYPVASEKCNILGNGTINHSSLNSSINYSTTAWNQYQHQSPDHSLQYPVTLNSLDLEHHKISQDEKYDSSTLFSPVQVAKGNSMLRSPINPETGTTYVDLVREHNRSGLPVQSLYCTHLKNYSKTLPGNNYYCGQQSQSPNQLSPSVRTDTIRRSQKFIQTHCNHTQLNLQNTSQYAVSPLDCASKNYEHEYEVAPYYAHSNASSSSHTYSKPYFYYLSNNAVCLDAHTPNSAIQKYKPYRSFEIEPRSELSVCSSSQSEIHVDYLTDASSSNDGLGSTLSRSLTLPLAVHHYPGQKSKNITDNVDNTPDSAVGLDYSPQPENELKSPSQIGLETGVNKPLEFFRLSTSSLNDALKVQSGFIGKFVNGVATNVGYSPLNLDDSCTITPTSECSLNGIKKTSSVENVSQSESSSIDRSKSNRPANPLKLSIDVSQHSSSDSYHVNPVTCL